MKVILEKVVHTKFLTVRPDEGYTCTRDVS